MAKKAKQYVQAVQATTNLGDVAQVTVTFKVKSEFEETALQLKNKLEERIKALLADFESVEGAE